MTEIKLYNTRTRRKEVFQPIDPSNVRMYVCGPTVYDRAHIGNARPAVVFDVLYRLLRHVYGEDAVTYVRNFTDVDDKINEKAAATGRPIRDITDETIGWYHDDMGALGVMRMEHEPRCTEYIPQMVEMGQTLIDKGYAYEAEGHVLFSVETYERYGKLSGRSVDDMIAGARVEVAPYKKNPMDFVIWKPSSDDQPGWDSPWGKGRPGWHIECSAMAEALLWEKPLSDGVLSENALKHPHVFDIHGGGLDLQFPHHENELAQSCCAHDRDVMANWWMHNEMLRVEGEKMSKSLGNFFTVRDLLDQGIPGEVIRLMLLETHYRKPLDWTNRRLNSLRLRLRNVYDALEGFVDLFPDWLDADDLPPPSSDVVEPLSDDLNSNLAMTNFFARVRAFDSNLREEARQILSDGVLLGLFGRGQRPSPLVARPLGAAETVIQNLIVDRQNARKNKDFARADAIRDGFAAAGVIVKDTPDGAVWELAPDFDADKLEALK